MNKSQIWYGFLDAGKRSSAVVIDPKINAGMDSKIYVYNLARNQILEYKRDIVESKLRDLTKEEEGQMLAELKSAYEKAVQNFSVSNESASSSSYSGKSSASSSKKNDEYDVDIDLDIDDLDVDLDLEDD